MLSPLRCTHRGSRIGCFVKVDCGACHHVTLLTPEALLQQGLSPSAKVLDLKGRLRCRGWGRKERAVVSVKWRPERLKPGFPGGERRPADYVSRSGVAKGR
jgi:hypothetical protein